MPSKTKLKNAAIAARSAALPKIPKELLDQFVTGPMTGEAVNAASMAFKKALIERAMGAELGHHLGYAGGAARPETAANQRNGRSAKTVLNSCLLLRLRVLGFPARIADRQIEPLLIFPVPALQGILGWVTQLTDGWPHAFAEFDVELDRSNPVFVRIHELPPGSPSFCPHPHPVSSQ